MNFLHEVYERLEEEKFTFSKKFYSYLFRSHPEIKFLFREDEVVEALTFVENIEVFISGANDLDALTPYLKRLGLKHKVYRVKKSHYPFIKEAFIKTFKNLCKDLFNERIKQEFNDLYDHVSEIMILGSRRM